MKNKIISFVLIGSILATSSLQADLFDKSSSTSYSQWKDPSSDMTYTNFGSVNFKFKKSVTSFAPWVKLRPPGVKAGCGGVSLDAGFAAFLDLETIGDQLEQAISSVGMGVIVVLIQTMPSIGKAYENIQKLVRKMQSMLQNACQLTVQGLSNDPWVKDKKKQMQDAVNDSEGMTWFNDTMKGVETKIDAAKKILTCDSKDHNCIDNAKNILSGTNPNTSESGAKSKNTSLGISGEIATAVTMAYANATNDFSRKEDSLSNVFSGKFLDNTLEIDPTALTAFKIKLAMFGILAIQSGDGSDAIKGINEDNSINTTEAAEATEDSSGSPSYTAIFISMNKLNSVDNIKNFLTGYNADEATGENSLYVSADINYVIDLSCDKTTKDGGCSGNLSNFQYLQALPGAKSDTTNNIAVSWEGIEKNTYKTILNAIDQKKYPLPANPIGVYMPNGNDYVQMIKKYASPEDVEKYAQFLSRLNVRYAVEAFVREAKADAYNVVKGENKQAKVALEQYIKNVDSVGDAVLKSIDDYSGDIAYLNEINQIFDQLKQNSLQKRMKRVKSQ